MALSGTAYAGPAPFIPLSRYVPSSAGLFVTVRNVGDLTVAIDRTHAWRVLEILAGSPPDRIRSSNFPAILARLLGLAKTIDPVELLPCEVGLVAPSGLQLGEAAFLVRVPHASVVDRWFPVRGRTAVGAIGKAQFFQTRGGLTVCVRDRIVAVSHRWGPGSLLRQVMNLMAGRGGATLERAKSFRELTTHFPDNQLAMAYLVRDRSGATGSVGPSLFWPDIDRAVIGLREGQGRIDVAVRASLAQSHAKPRLAQRAIDRLFRLPQTTLFASATTIDLDQAYEKAAQVPSVGPLARYLALLAAFQKAATGPSQAVASLGPHVIVVAGQDLREDGATPQAAIMVECADPHDTRDRAERFAARIIRLVQLLDPATEDVPLAIETSTHLGATIRHIPLADYAQTSQLPLIRLLANADPAWTVWEDWLIVALNRTHLERLLDAQLGLLPTLGSTADVQTLRRGAPSQSVLSIIQADLVSKTVDRWLAAHKAGAPSLLDPAWWQGRPGSRGADELPFGLELEEDPEVPGAALVSSVAAGSAAEGKLQPGDQILGVDGTLLSLTSPADDARRRLGASVAVHGPTLRLRRGHTVIDTVLPRRRGDVLLTTLRTQPARAIDELASLGRTLRFASFAVNTSDEMKYSARLSLRFVGSRAATASSRHERRTPRGE